MKLTGLHLLLTYQCNYECDHCFLWGGPSQGGTMTLAQIRDIYRQAHELGTVEGVYLEGGEPFLYYPILVRAAQEAADLGFQVGQAPGDGVQLLAGGDLVGRDVCLHIGLLSVQRDR